MHILKKLNDVGMIVEHQDYYDLLRTSQERHEL